MIERIGSASIALTRLIVMIVAITVLLPSAAQAACALWDVSGTWVVDQSNNASCEFRVRQSGTKLTGAATQLGGRGWAPINGTINGDWARLEVKWSNGTRGEYGGKIRLDGETIHGLTYDAFHRTGAQVQWTAIHHFGCAPVPPPAPPPPPAAIPPKAPMNVDAVRENGSGIYVSWSGDNSAEWYVVERRTALSPLIEAPRATPWQNASGNLRPSPSPFLARYPVMPGGVKNIFRVVAHNSGGQAASAPVAERTSNITRGLPGR